MARKMARKVYEWRQNNACVATYNVLESDRFMDQFEDVDIPFADAPDTRMSQLRYLSGAAGKSRSHKLLGIEMARAFVLHVSKTYTLKQTPDATQADFLRAVAGIFGNGERTIRDLAEVLDQNVKFPDEN